MSSAVQKTNKYPTLAFVTKEWKKKKNQQCNGFDRQLGRKFGKVHICI